MGTLDGWVSTCELPGILCFETDEICEWSAYKITTIKYFKVLERQCRWLCINGIANQADRFIVDLSCKGLNAVWRWSIGSRLGLNNYYATVTPARKSPSCKSEIFAKLSGTWLSRGSYGVFMAVMGSSWLLRGLRPFFFVAVTWMCDRGIS